MKESEHAGSDQTKLAMDAWLGEYQTLRDEIIYRMRVADGFAAASVTITGVVLGIALSAFDPVLLILPLLNLYFVFAYLNQHRHVRALGNYIRNRIQPRIVALSKERTVFGWESYYRTLPEWAFIPYLRIPNAGFPVLSSILALGIAYDRALALRENRLLWWIGVLLTVISAILWWRDEILHRQLDREQRPTPGGAQDGSA